MGNYATNFDVQGSTSANGPWTGIVTNISSTGGWQEVTLPGTSSYSHYRVQTNSLNAGHNHWQLYTVQGFGNNTPGDNEGYGGGSQETSCPCARTYNGAPVDTAIGNFWHTFTDLSVPGRGPSLQLSHTYNAQVSNSNQNGSFMGYGWSHSYNWYINRDGSNNYLVHQGNGAVVPFNSDMSHPLRVEATLVSAGGYLVYTTTHGLTTFYFKPLNDPTAPGKLDHITDRNGYTTSLSYNADGSLHTVTDPASRQLTLAYTVTSTVSYLTGVTDPTGRAISFGYDSSGNLQTATDVGGQHMGFTYETVGGYHRLLSMTDPNNGVLTNQYDASNRVITQTDPLNRSTLYAYNDLGNGSKTTRITDTLGLVSVFYYADNMLTQVVSNPGAQQAVTTRSYQYGTTWPSKITAPLGNSTIMAWDNQGNVISTTDALTRNTQYLYNTTNDLTTITNTRSLTATFGYDTYGNVTTITQPITETNQLITTTLTYDPQKPGDVVAVTNPLGNSWNMRYNTYGYVISATNPLNDPPALYSYNSIGWLLSETTPRNYTSTYTYTTYGEPQLVTNTLGYTTVYTYDNVGNLTSSRDANGRVITSTYDLDNELTKATHPDNTHLDYGYDGLGRTITKTNELDQLTQYTYDDINRVVTYTDALTRTSVYSYDLAGNLATVVNAKNQTTTLGYDAAYQLKSVNYSDGTTPNVSFLYNALGMRTVMTDGVGTSTYTYDSLGRLTALQDGNSNTVSYGYDIASRPLTITYPYNGVSTRNVIRGYNAANQLTSVKDWLNNTTTFGYNVDGGLTSITRPNSVNTNVTYDAADQALTKSDAITATPFLSFTFQLDPVGARSAITEANTTGNIGTHAYNYDTRYRLTQDNYSTSPSSANTWQYDAATQILTTTYQVGAGTTINGVRTFDAANEIKSLVETQGGTTLKNIKYTFDNNGNRTQRADKSGSTINYAYDQVNRLTTYNVGPGATTYKYNGDGLRMQKAAGLTTTQFSWDIGVEGGLPLLLQDNGSSGGSYIYGPGGMLLEEVVPGVTPGSSVPYYYHTDWVGSVRALTNGSGAVSNTYTYDAYGKPLSSTGSVSNPFGYTGEYTDPESGFVYLRARYYDPESQQFLTVDPLLASTAEAYSYVGGNPITYSDSSGLCRDEGGDSRPDGMCYPRKWKGVYWFEDGSYSTSSDPNSYANRMWINVCTEGEKAAGFCTHSNYSPLGPAMAYASGAMGLVSGGGTGLGSAMPGGEPDSGEFCLAKGESDPEQTGRMNLITPATSPIWRGLEPVRGRGLRSNGASGRNKRYYDWDYTHQDIEVYDRNGNHLGSMDPMTGNMTKPPVPGRTVNVP